MPSDPIWWLALTLQLLALPGTVLPVLPGLLWLPVGLVLGLVAGGIGILIGPWLGASAVEFWSLQRLPIDKAMSGYRPLKAQLGQAAQVGLAVVFGLLVSQAVQLLMAVLGVVGFIWMTGR